MNALNLTEKEMIFVTDLIKVNFADITQGLQRNRAYFFNVLTERWTIDNIMENVRKKILLCKDNINRIYQKTLTKSQKLAALLLFFISGFAILEFLRGLSEFLHRACTFYFAFFTLSIVLHFLLMCTDDLSYQGKSHL